VSSRARMGKEPGANTGAWLPMRLVGVRLYGPVRVWLALVCQLGALGAVGCSSRPFAGASADAAADASSAPFVVTQHLPGGTDSYRCSYLVVSNVDTFLAGASHVATTGMHHVLLFRTDLTSIPDGGTSLVDCYAGPSSPMRHMRGEVYGSQARSGSFAFPAGVGLPLRAGEVLLLQGHFSNPRATDIDATVQLTLTTASQGITTSAGVFFFNDPFVDIPAGAFSKASMRCLLPSDITVVSVSSHDHALAQSVSAFLDPPVGPSAPTPFYAGLDAANPLPLQASVPAGAGSRIRFTCVYQNVNGTGEVLQGLDVHNEMCVLSGAYYPALNPDVESCALAPDDFGTGAASCSQTLACVSACPAGTEPPADLGLSSTPNVDPCWQRCVVASCADASALLFALERCTQSHCAAECGMPASASCASCRMVQCPRETSACASDACGG
jgi:Copper type II ascorbate-dependent monooxygenase, C-terminal domain